MIDFRFILLFIATLMVIVIGTSKEENEVVHALLYVSGFIYLFVGMDMMIHGIDEISLFLSTTTSIVFWGMGIILLFKSPLIQIEEDN